MTTMTTVNSLYEDYALRTGDFPSDDKCQWVFGREAMLSLEVHIMSRTVVSNYIGFRESNMRVMGVRCVQNDQYGPDSITLEC